MYKQMKNGKEIFKLSGGKKWALDELRTKKVKICSVCKTAPATGGIKHPDAGVDFGEMGSISCCDRCYAVLEEELRVEGLSDYDC